MAGLRGYVQFDKYKKYTTSSVEKKNASVVRVHGSSLLKSTAGRPGSSEVPRNPLDTLGREFDPGKRDFSH